MKKRDEILELAEDIALLDEKFDDALIGFIDIAGCTSKALYDFKNETVEFLPEYAYFTKCTLEELSEIDGGNLLTADGLEDALIGYAITDTNNAIAVYDTEKCIDILAEQFEKDGETGKGDDETWESIAYEYFYYNTAGAYMGGKTPGFATLVNDDSMDTENWAQNIEFVWDESKTKLMGIIVSGEKLTEKEYHERYPLSEKGELKEIKKSKKQES